MPGWWCCRGAIEPCCRPCVITCAPRSRAARPMPPPNHPPLGCRGAPSTSAASFGASWWRWAFGRVRGRVGVGWGSGGGRGGGGVGLGGG